METQVEENDTKLVISSLPDIKKGTVPETKNISEIMIDVHV